MNTKEAIVQDMKSSHATFMDVINTLTPEDAEKPDICGWWTARQDLAHILAWQVKAVEVIEALRDGHEVATPQDDDIFNAEAVEYYKGDSWVTLKVMLEDTVNKLLDLADELSPECWQDPRVGWFRGSTIIHYEMHQPDFERALEV